MCALQSNSDALLIWVGDVEDETDEPGLAHAKELKVQIQRFHSITEAIDWIEQNIGSSGLLISGAKWSRFTP